MNKKVLFLDDEQSILNAMERSFSITDFECYFVQHIDEALTLLNEHVFGVIVSDMRMPEMDGVAFILKAREQQPLAVSMILSGYSDIDTVMKAINEGHVWRYISKDLNRNELILNVKNAWEYYQERVGRQQLLLELSLKNEQLETMNSILEEKVAERTWELKEQSEILSMMLQGETIDTLMNRIITLIVHSFHIEKVFIYVPFLSKTYCALDIEMGIDVNSLVQKTIGGDTIVVERNITAIPLEKSGKKLGVLVIDNSEHVPVEDVMGKFRRISTIVNLALYQHKVVVDAPETIKNIEQILSEM